MPRSGGRQPGGTGSAVRGAVGAVLLLGASGLHAAGAQDAAADSALRPFVLRTVRVHDRSAKYAVYVPPGYDRSQEWPCVVFLHGSGECGTDGIKPTLVGLGAVVRTHPERWPCIIVMPQKPIEDAEWEEHEELVLACLHAVRAAYRIDPERIALTGMSQGGHGTWMLGARHPDLFSCLAPVCGYGRAHTVARRVADRPVWAFHGLRDDVVDPHDTQEIVAAIQAQRRARGLVPDGPAGARATLYPDLNHGCWDAAYGEAELPPWLLARHGKR
jgi:predicted peptidase